MADTHAYKKTCQFCTKKLSDNIAKWLSTEDGESFVIMPSSVS